MQLVFASNNKNKIIEIERMLPFGIQIASLKEIGCNIDIPETGNTFEENALIKAKYIKEHFNADAFADDSGLEVTALNNAPGVYSARYAGETKNDLNNINKLLEELQGKHNRAAQFRTVIALILGSNQYLFDGVIKGNITRELRGEGGFGYDPVFIPEGYSKTFAEMSLEEKNKISHRAIATGKLISFLKSIK